MTPTREEQLADPPWDSDRLVPCSKGLLKRRQLPWMLGASEWRDQRFSDRPVFVGWGRKQSGLRAAERARSIGSSYLLLEDGFVRSVDPGFKEEPLSIVCDDQGIYYDAHSPSRLESLICAGTSPGQLERAQELGELWREQGVSKYNHGPTWQASEAHADDVLIVDQTSGDASIAYGLADQHSFARMLEAAADECPASRLLLKLHPDVIAGKRQGHFPKLGRALAKRVQILARPVHPATLLASVKACYVVTSQMGFEALLWKRPVRCFGMPFYAGWGLTQDEIEAPVRRSRSASLETLVHAALVDYSRYLAPESGTVCSPESLIRWMGLQRRMRTRFGNDKLQLIGFSSWKKPIARLFFQGAELDFFRKPPAPAQSRHPVVWGRKLAAAAAKNSIRVEDGFLRSVGLGADLVKPVSWVMDRRGIYFDATVPSDLESLLQNTEIDEQLKQRATELREKIVSAGITKYNTGNASWRRRPDDRQVILVPGQVESDASIRYGAFKIRSNIELLEKVRANNPDSTIIYKPHPDVVAGLRKGELDHDRLNRLCDQIVEDVPMNRLLEAVDEVHVITSLAGFEALLRGVRVVTYGMPFYAGWGLTEDKLECPRRTRERDLDELVAACLILYPVYISWTTGRYTTPERALQELVDWRQKGPDRMLIWRKGLRSILRLFKS